MARDPVIEMIAKLENNFIQTVQQLRFIQLKNVKRFCRGGGQEYLGRKLEDWLKNHGINQELTATYSPESN